MRPGTRGIIVSAIIRTFALTGILLIGCVAQFAAEQHHSNVICREKVSTASRNELARRLSLITGWPRLGFDDHGSLRVGDASPFGGSVTARNLMTKALAGNSILILEEASNRSDVVFSRVVPGRLKNNVTENMRLFVVLIDFADFDHLMGDAPAREAFNVGWGVLHEIDHVVNDSVDSEGLDRAGECEAHINQMRRECHLPERTEYFFTFFPHSEGSEFKTKLVRLAFDREDGSARRHHRYWLIWDATQVGGLPETGQIASLR